MARTERTTWVVRSDDRWWLAPVPGTTPSPLEPNHLRELLAASASPGDRVLAPSGRLPYPVEVVVSASRTLVGVVERGTLVVTEPGGRRTALDETDLQIIEQVSGGVRLGDLSVGVDLPDLDARVAALVGAHVLHVEEPQHEPTDGALRPPPDPTVAATAASEPIRTPGPPSAPADTRIPVYSVWHRTVGPLLSLGMLTAAARAHDGGALEVHYDIRRPEPPESLLADLAQRPGPAVLLCSDYVFTLEDNLRTAHAALAVNPDLVVLHGGPSSPKYHEDAQRFFDEHGAVAHVLARGEGERTICELLEALAGTLPSLDTTALSRVDGLCFRDAATGELVTTADRERIADLDSLPSPFLTGEFDEIPLGEWTQPPYFETNRGCPYGCTFCDWGSATQSRIRKFDLDRVAAEFEWAAARGLAGTYICDANFGILPRDVEIAERLAGLRATYGAPSFVTFTPAKNTTRHLTRILDTFRDAGISTNTSISLQTVDDATLDVVGRNNISTDAYLALAADLRRRGHALTGDLILGLPGQSYSSYRDDVQFMVDHEIMPRTFSLRMLPNAPMNEPGYRTEHGVLTNDRGVVVSTATLSPADRAHAARLRYVEAVTERYGLARHVMRQLQWDQGIAATAVMEAMLSVAEEAPERFPSIAWLVDYFDLFPVAPLGWPELTRELHRMALDVLGAADSPGLRCALAVQEFLMPAPGRRFPDTLPLEHDYVTYFTDATAELYRSGRAGVPTRPLESYPPAELTVHGDPLGLCTGGLQFWGDSRDETFEGDFQIGALAANELDSPLVRLLPGIAAHHDVVRRRLETAVPSDVASHPPMDTAPARHDGAAPVGVELRTGRR